jgi:hypothetical protein
MGKSKSHTSSQTAQRLSSGPKVRGVGSGMSTLTSIEKRYLDTILNYSSGYVLDFSNPTFQEFIREKVSIDIYSDKYTTYADIQGNASKGKRLKSLWDQESDQVVGIVLQGLLEHWKFLQIQNGEASQSTQYQECLKIVNRLLGKSEQVKETTEADFLSRDFKNLNFSKLSLDIQFESVISQRIIEIQQTLKAGASLSVIFLCGSTLEGLLLDVAGKNPQKFNTSKSAPMDSKSGCVKKIHEWSLANLIDVAHETGFIGLDIKKFGHVLRDFRNYIHPRQQAVQQFNPDKHTAEISWKVLQATIASLCGER